MPDRKSGPKPTAKATTRTGGAVELVLYKMDGCPYCARVVSFLREKRIPVTYRDIEGDPGAAADLVKLGGIDQVPCLSIDGKALYESLDIIAYLERECVPAKG
ncbi:MAG: glutathione S-transferase N-terminal domain-containing protein [Planctomycetota bacterium]